MLAGRRLAATAVGDPWIAVGDPWTAVPGAWPLWPAAVVGPPVTGCDAVTVPQPAVTAAVKHTANPIDTRFV
jgi:hypothetical protein